MNILLTAAAGPSAICFARSLRDIPGVRLIGTNADKTEASPSLVDKLYVVPLANDAGYLDTMRSIVENEAIDFCVPLVDEEVVVLSEHSAILGCRVLISPSTTIRYTNDKSLAYEVLGEYMPERYEKESVTDFPIFAKPRIGRGGKGARVVSSADELRALPAETYLFQKLLTGAEVSVDAFFSLTGDLIVAVPRVRSVIEEGISIAGSVFFDQALLELLQKISKKLSFIGAVNFQFMRDNNEYKLLEINARGSGGMGITIRAGADMPKLSYELMHTGRIATVPTVRPGTYSNFEEVLQRQEQKKRALSAS